jgi:hypothetical protein
LAKATRQALAVLENLFLCRLVMAAAADVLYRWFPVVVPF